MFMRIAMSRHSVVALTLTGLIWAAAVQCQAAGPGLFRRWSAPGAPPTRSYRSYSVSPSQPVVPEGAFAVDPVEGRSAAPPATVVTPAPAPAPVMVAPPVTPSRPQASAPSRTRSAPRSSNSKPSYMRADSKALGRFGQ